MKLDKKFLEKYLNGVSPSGYEVQLGGQKIWINYIKQFVDNVEIDNYGNAYAYYTKKDDKLKTVLLDAHADEIGFFVFDITDKGFLKIGRLGGSDITITPSSRVNVWSEKGMVNGVFGHPAIHVHRGEFKANIDEIFVDIGVSSKKDVKKLGIVVGTPITMEGDFMNLGKYYCGRSLDDKIGGYITTQVVKQLKKDKIVLPFNLVIVNSVQEEVGLKGASMVANKINPDIAIAIDVTHDTESPAYNKTKQGSLTAGDGVVIMTAPSLQKNLVKLLIDTAIMNQIKYQRIASGSSSGTNADSYSYPNGSSTALLKMAMRYMHTTIETVHKKDVKSAIKLLINVLQNKDILKDMKYEI